MRTLSVARHALVWAAAIIAIPLVGVSLKLDMTGQSAADEFLIARGSLGVLRTYLWLEAGVLVAIVAAVGAHVISGGLAVRRGERPRLFGIAPASDRRIPSVIGYALIVLGSALVALSISTLGLFNSCRYMRLV